MDLLAIVTTLSPAMANDGINPDILSSMTPPGMLDTTEIPNSNSTLGPKIDPIFLQTRLAQAIAGVFTWLALFVTCHQVSKTS